MKERDMNINSNEIDALIEAEYQRYRNSSGKAAKQESSGSTKENNRLCQNSQNISFGRMKEMNKEVEQYHVILKLMQCENYEDVLKKIQRVNKADQFLRRVKEMIQDCEPKEEPNLCNSWRIIKEVMEQHYKEKEEGLI